ncbi:S-layer homology domain-containing protein [Thermosediminibacter litoriperuensis]|uniref:S-layer family protein n=1 Tax=Thermosediminibacter litoriperuensis TaxID=291989 RepID=A0A5S5APN1_9FIRM|nr:S-layer homology domain-containing protein [Thermosediminibacter litoriperuensis]TYP52496.1 S-layer family protein [Thermosediminibacter litoriperuensis]
MKRFKKLLVTLLVLTFVLSTVSVGFAATTETSPSVVRAKALGILKGDEKGNLNLDKPITRAEALTLIVRISGLESSANLMKGQTQFKDVPATHWATGYINLGVGQGIIKGYPDGTFRPNANVTFAEMAKMLLYAMNYGVTVEGAPWPAGVMGKADDLGIFDDVNAVPNVPALRGDVVEMIDNSLTIKHLKQVGYGDLKQYEEGDETFLSKLDVEEIDGRITAVDVKDKEVTVDPDDEDLKTKTYTLLNEEIDIESLLGVEATVWVNDNDEIFFIDPNMDDVKVDIVDENMADDDDDEIDLKLVGDSFDLADDVKVYINGAKADLEDLKAGMYGNFVFEDDEIVYINVKEWNKVDAGVVTKVEDKIITYFDENGTEDEIDMEDPDDGYVITLDGKKIDLDDIEKNDVIYVADYDDVYHILVVRKTVEGKVERVKDEEVKINGTTYDVSDKATYSLNEDEDIAAFTADAVTDMAGETALTILDLAGEVRHITSAVESTSDDIFGVLTKVDTYNEVVKIFANGESKSYEIDGGIYAGDQAKDAAEISLDDLYAYTANHDGDSEDDEYVIVKFALNKDGEIDDLYVLGFYEADSGFKTVSDVVYDVDAEFVDYTIRFEDVIEDFDEDHDKIEASDEYFVTSTTTIIDEIDDMDIVKWDDIKEKEVGDDVDAIVVFDDKNDAKLVVFVAGFTTIAEDEELGVVLDKFVEDGDWKATVKVYDGEEKDYVLADKDDVQLGETIVFTVNSDNELDPVVTVVYENPEDTIAVDNSDDVYKYVDGTVKAKDGSYIKVDEDGDGDIDGTYKADAKTLIYDVTGDDVLGDIDEASLSDVKVGKNVGLVVDGKSIAVLYIISEPIEEEEDTDAAITANFDETTDELEITVANVEDAYAIRVYDAETNEVLTSFATLDENGTAIFTVTSGENPVFVKVRVYDDNMETLLEKVVAVRVN